MPVNEQQCKEYDVTTVLQLCHDPVLSLWMSTGNLRSSNWVAQKTPANQKRAHSSLIGSLICYSSRKKQPERRDVKQH